LDFTSIKQSATGASLAFVVFVLFVPAITPAASAATSSTYFSFTMIAPNTNPVRVQWAEIIQNSYQENGIAANLVFTAFSPLIDRVWGGATNGPLFAAGGYDAIFIGWGGGTVLPDYGTDNVVNYKSSTPSAEFPPNGNNYAFFDNATYNTLANEYATSFNVTQRELLAQQMVTIVAQQRPYLVIIGGLGAVPDNPIASNLYLWNQQKTWNTGDAGEDFQHWKVTGGSTVINVGISADLTCQNVIQTSECNSQYDQYLQGSSGPTIANLEELDPRTLTYYDALATSITSSPNHLQWSVKFLAHNFQDGVPVTSNDYVFTNMLFQVAAAGYVGLGTYQSLFGLYTEYTYLNGTHDYVSNGTYYHDTPPSGFPTPTATFTAVNPTEFNFTMPTAYPFTDPTLTGINAFPMHALEQIGFANIATSYWTTFNSAPTTIHWNTAEYGGNGTYTTWGAFGDGPYVYEGYDKVAKVGTLEKWSGYWNATGLESIGEFNAQIVHVVTINGKDSALAAFANGQVNDLDNNYQFDKSDAAAISAAGGINIFMNAPNNGWQEVGLNLHHPVFGTGTGTPLGQSNPARAAFAARMVREAMSYLIPRGQIVSQLLQGLGVEGITQFCTCFSAYMPPGLQPDPYNVTAALSFLAAAGYNTGVAPPSTGSTIGSNFNTQITVPGSTVVAPSFLLGQSFTLSGLYTPLPKSLMVPAGGHVVVLEQSTNGGTSWIPVEDAFTNTGGQWYMTYTPTVNGSLQYRVFFTGLNVTTAVADAYGTPSAVESTVPPYNPFPSQWLNDSDTYYGAVSTLNVGTLGGLISQLASGAQLTSLANQLSTSLGGVQSSINSLNSGQQTANTNIATANSNIAAANTNISNLQSSVNTLTDVAYAALAVAIILGLAAIVLSRRKPAS